MVTVPSMSETTSLELLLMRWMLLWVVTTLPLDVVTWKRTVLSPGRRPSLES